MSAAFSIDYAEDARLQLRAIPSRQIRDAITSAITALATDPEPITSDSLWGEWEGHRRLSVRGVYRVVYVVDHRARRIEIVRIGHRGSVYQR